MRTAGGEGSTPWTRGSSGSRSRRSVRVQWLATWRALPGRIRIAPRSSGTSESLPSRPLFKQQQQQQQQQEQAKHAAAEKQGETGAADAALSHHSQMPSVMRRGVASRSLSVSCVSVQPFFFLP